MVRFFRFNLLQVLTAVVVAGLLFYACFLYLSAPNTAEQSQNRYIMVSFGEFSVKAELAETLSEKARGLGGREELPADEGMFFVFDKSGKHGFWMKDMFFPIDIIWLDENFKIVHVEEKVSPATYPKIFYPETNASYVLEVNSGTVEKSGISVGQQMGIFWGDYSF